MQELIYDYVKEYVSEDINEVLLELIGGMYLDKMLEHAKRQVGSGALMVSKEKLYKEGLDSKERRGEEAYELKLDQEKKQIFLNVKLNPRESERVRKEFFDEYKTLLENVNSEEYTLEIDCRALSNAVPYLKMQEDIAIYCYKSLNRIRLIFTEKQIALAMQYKRMFSKLDAKEIEIVIK